MAQGEGGLDGHKGEPEVEGPHGEVVERGTDEVGWTGVGDTVIVVQDAVDVGEQSEEGVRLFGPLDAEPGGRGLAPVLGAVAEGHLDDHVSAASHSPANQLCSHPAGGSCTHRTDPRYFGPTPSSNSSKSSSIIITIFLLLAFHTASRAYEFAMLKLIRS